MMTITETASPLGKQQTQQSTNKQRQVHFSNRVRLREIPGLVYYSSEMKSSIWMTESEKNQAKVGARAAYKLELQKRKKSLHLARLSREAVLKEQNSHDDIFASVAIEYMEHSTKALKMAQLQGKMTELEVRGPSGPLILGQ